MSGLFKTLILSLLLHITLVWILSMFPDSPPPSRTTTEVEVLTQPANIAKKKSQQDKQIVRNALVPEELQKHEDEDLARFLSKDRVRVKKESQASRNGMTQNNRGAGDNSQQAQEASTKKAQQQQPEQKNASEDGKKRDLSKEGFQTWTPPGGAAMQQPRRVGGGPSTIGETLPTDVSIGNFTALNTDRYTYYTFYARIEELVRFRWVTRVQNSIDSMDRVLASSLGGRPWTTQALFLLKPDGHLVSAQIMKASGVNKFDAAAIGAFQEAAVFPNPPKELVEDDGYIHLKYDFTVNYNANMIR